MVTVPCTAEVAGKEGAGLNIGGRLRDAREARGLTIDAISRSTRVQPRVLSAIERNDAVALPPRPYGRGFVRVYASEVGLDPEETVRAYFSQFAPEPDPAAPAQSSADDQPRAATWLWPLAAILGYAGIGAIVILAGSWAIRPRQESGAVGTAGATVPPAVTSAPQPAAAEGAAPVERPVPAGVSVSLEATGPSWLEAHVDGRRTVYRLLQPAERLTLNGSSEIVIRTGDAGALVWRVNGGDAAPIGGPGKVRSVRVTPKGVMQTHAPLPNAQ